jgi:hypothetical protein
MIKTLLCCAGIDGAGGGGGSSYVHNDATIGQTVVPQSAHVSIISQNYIDDVSIGIDWSTEWATTQWGEAANYDIELASGFASADFGIIGSVQVDTQNPSLNLEHRLSYSVSGLAPSSDYQVRIIPIYSRGRGSASQPLLFRTLDSTFNYWEQIIPRRLSLTGTGRGFSDPVLERPHLDVGVQIYTKNVQSITAADFTDARTSTVQAAPSGRRGHSMSLVMGSIFMFGGRTNGKANI